MWDMPDQHEYTGSVEVGARLQKARIAAGLTQRQALQALGRDPYNTSWISNKETGKRNLNPDELAAFARLYRVTTDSLVGVDTSGPENVLARLGAISESLVAVPVYDMEAHAGFASGSVRDYSYRNPPPTAVSKHLVAITVRGDCLVPDVMDGYFIVVDTERTAKAGDIIVISEGEEVHVCRLEQRGKRLVATNNDGTMDLETVRIEGVVIQISRDL